MASMAAERGRLQMEHNNQLRRTWGVLMMLEEQRGGGCSYSGSRGGENSNEDVRGGRGGKFAAIGSRIPAGPAQQD